MPAEAEAAARMKIRKIWHMGALFHNTYRFPRKRRVPKIDRLAGILQRGLIAPAACPEGLVRSDLNVVLDGAAIGYDRLVFLHRYGEQLYLYTISEPGRFAVFVDPELPVITQEDMGEHWCVLCQDEVYVRDAIAIEKILGIAVDPGDADAVLREFHGEFQRLQMPLYTYAGDVVWPTRG